jgi:hypothetical protein
MRESVLNQLITCKVCHKAYFPDSDVCFCPEEAPEEPAVDSKSFDEVTNNEI